MVRDVHDFCVVTWTARRLRRADPGLARASRWPQDGLRRTTLQPREQNARDARAPKRTLSMAKCLLRRKTTRWRRHETPDVRTCMTQLFS